MRKILIGLAVVMQIAVLAFMAGEREYILRNGRAIYLRTAPIDPRDIFRGDYVRLNYELSRIPFTAIKGTENVKELKKGHKVYVSLREGPNGLYEMVSAGIEEPQNGVFITGRSMYPHRLPATGSPIWISYGIEAYFVEQGKGRDIEKRRGSRTDIQIPLEMEIAVGPGGRAAIRGFRWSPLGIGLRVLRNPPRNSQDSDALRSASVELTLANETDQPLAIVTLPDYCSFDLEAVPWTKQRWALAQDPCAEILPTNLDVLTLAPRQKRRFEFDFSTERWLVEADDKIKEIGTLDGSEQFRLVYRPPDEASCRHLSQREIIWHGYMPSRVFHGRGNID
ncbi:MAG: GDYXXLXY domain-containing protein [Desulfobacterales bacterium]|jgi:uncharacterized membrane-anchored protein